MPMVIDLTQFESVSEAADRLGCSTTHAYRLLETGRLRWLPSPAGKLVEKASVDRYIAERRGS